MEKIVENIREIRKSKGYSQSVIANAIGCDVSNWSKVEQGLQNVQIGDLEKIANCLGLRVIDLFTYPDVYVKKGEESERISVTFEVSPDKRDILLNLVTKQDNQLKQ